MKMILSAIQGTLLSFSFSRNMQEAMMKYDFKIDAPRKNLMQLCFSPLAAWPFFIMLGMIYIDPTKYAFTLQRLLGENRSLGLFLLDGSLSAMLVTFGIFFISEWVFRKEYLLVGIVFYFLAKSDLHLHLATAAVLSVYLSRACYLFWLKNTLESRSRKIWTIATALNLIAVIVVVMASIYALDYLQANQYFSGSISANRFEFLTSMVVAFYAVPLLFLSAWGHFYVRRRVEPSFLPIYFSTSNWILLFNMSSYLQKLLLEKTSHVLAEHKKSVKQFNEIKDQSPGLGMNHLLTTLNKEISYLQVASSRLTID
ncbi:MAG: hypothetical protein H7328_12845 [Bdellovibrio sp.]|nr:hypothetical protein [Bdellovibrio sp.]